MWLVELDFFFLGYVGLLEGDWTRLGLKEGLNDLD